MELFGRAWCAGILEALHPVPRLCLKTTQTDSPQADEAGAMQGREGLVVGGCVVFFIMHM